MCALKNATKTLQLLRSFMLHLKLYSAFLLKSVKCIIICFFYGDIFMGNVIYVVERGI